MCGRTVLDVHYDALGRAIEEVIDIRLPPTMPWAPRYNLGPMQQSPVVLREGADATLALLRWGLVPAWARDAAIGAKAVNARAESAADKPMFRAALRQRRCAVPVSGFYEWKHTPEGKVPYFLHPRVGSLLFLAGLWESWTDPAAPGSEALRTFTVVTCEPNAMVARIHDRMPVILAPRDVARWIDPATNPSAVAAMMAPAPEDTLAAHPVSAAVGSIKNDTPELIAHREPQRSLFG